MELARGLLGLGRIGFARDVIVKHPISSSRPLGPGTTLGSPSPSDFLFELSMVLSEAEYEYR